MSGNDDLKAGVPDQRPASAKNQVAPKDAAINSSFQDKFALGEDDQAGVPMQRPVESRKVKALTEPALSEDLEPFGDQEDEKATASFSSIVSSPLLSAALVVFASGVLIVILSELFQFIKAVQSAPLFAQAIAYVFVGLLTLAFLIALVRLALAYRRLVVTPKIDLDAIQQAKRRAATRDQVARQVEAGYNSLQEIVKDYPVDDVNHFGLLTRCGMTSDEIKILKSNIKVLLRPENAGQSKWIEDCERLFVAVIDEAAKRRVKSYAQRVGVKTAISPTGLVDSLIVITNAVMMVEELCRLYGVRTGSWQSVLLTWRIFFSTFVSARLEERIGEIADSLFENALSSIPQVSKEVFAKISVGLLKRVAEGSVNMALFYRLGTATIVSLRPIKVSA